MLFNVLESVCLPVNNCLKLSNANSRELKLSLYNLNRQSANLYFISILGVALLQIVCSELKDW